MLAIAFTKKFFHRKFTVIKQRGYVSVKFLWFYLSWMSSDTAREALLYVTTKRWEHGTAK